MQKPMATDLETAEEMVKIAEDARNSLRGQPEPALRSGHLPHQAVPDAGAFRQARLHPVREPLDRGPQVRLRPGRAWSWPGRFTGSIRCAGWRAASRLRSTARTATSRLYQIEFSSGAVCNYVEYHNEDTFRNETPLRVWAEKGAVRANHRWNPSSRWERDLVEVRGYDWPKEIGWIAYNLPDDLTQPRMSSSSPVTTSALHRRLHRLDGRVHAVPAREASRFDQRPGQPDVPADVLRGPTFGRDEAAGRPADHGDPVAYGGSGKGVRRFSVPFSPSVAILPGFPGCRARPGSERRLPGRSSPSPAAPRRLSCPA